MIKLKKTIIISAPVKEIFNYISELENLTEIWPSLMQVKDIQQLPGGGNSFRFVYMMAGILIEGTGNIESTPNRRIIIQTTGGIQSTQIWTLELEANGTRATVEMEYNIPVPILGKLIEAVVVDMNDREGDLVMANLKVRMET